MRSSRRSVLGLALVAIGASAALSGCRDLLGIGNGDDTTTSSDGGGADASVQSIADGATTVPIDGGALKDAATPSDAGGATQEAGAVGVDARYAAWQPAPDTPTQLSTTNGGTVVVDAVTGLWWEQTNAQIVCTLAQASSYCAGLTTGGHSDWRVPTRVELVSIVDFAASIRRPAIFGAPASALWTQSRLIGDGTQVYAVNFVSDATFSLIENDTPGDLSGLVRCVRNGRPLPASPTSPLPAGLWVQQGNNMHNTLTGQSWEKTPATMPGDFSAATQHCASLPGAFRVPTARELDTLTDESRLSNPAWPAAFDGTQAEYWSQTPVDSTSNFTWKSSGLFSVEDTSQVDIYVRCVSP